MSSHSFGVMPTTSSTFSTSSASQPLSGMKVPSTTLQRGSTNSADVKLLQQALVKLGYMTQAQMNTGPGTFGPATEAALKNFQKANGLTADGIYGTNTRNKMVSLGATVGSGGGTTSKISNPLKSYTRVSSEFGMRNGKMHNGIDLAAPKGTPIYAAADGVVVGVVKGITREQNASDGGGYGNYVIIQHKDGTFSTLYAHCSKVDVSKGQEVKQGQKIGEVGNTGNSSGNHLHFEVRQNGTAVNPRNYISF